MTNKTILVFVFVLITIGTISAQESQSESRKTQECTLWVGMSEHPDPIIRHHEAFMDAFMKYINNRSMETVAVVSVEPTDSCNKSINKSINNDTCQVETVSSVTYDGRETITISIGNGTFVNYHCFIESSFSYDGVIQTRTSLKIMYQEEDNRISIRSLHEYKRESLTEERTARSINQFSYECTSTSISKYE